MSPVFMLIHNRGLRDTEIRTLTWGQIKFVAKIVHVGRVKNEAAEGRIVPLNSEIYQATIAGASSAWTHVLVPIKKGATPVGAAPFLMGQCYSIETGRLIECVIVPLVALTAIVVLPVITSVMAMEVLFALCESPLYMAVMVCAPTARDEVCRDAVLLLTAAGEPMGVVPS